jgi:hypothetical protein
MAPTCMGNKKPVLAAWQTVILEFTHMQDSSSTVAAHSQLQTCANVHATTLQQQREYYRAIARRIALEVWISQLHNANAYGRA